MANTFLTKRDTRKKDLNIDQITNWLKLGLKCSNIAKKLSVSRVTITRFLKQNNIDSKNYYDTYNVKLEESQSAINTIYYNYRTNANRKYLRFEISKEEFKKLIKQNCFYCNTEPSQKMYSNGQKISMVIYNGIDRIDNNIGYIDSNCVTCCKICNIMKNNLSLEQFKNHIKLLYLNFNDRE